MVAVETPLGGVRVLNIGIGWAGRVASMLLAEQGAEVIEIVRPGREGRLSDTLLDRCKTLVEIDLKEKSTLERATTLGKTANVVIENMRPGAADRLGLDHHSLGGDTSGVVYVSLPGFAEGDVNRSLAAWEGSIDAATGVYTDLSSLGRLLGGGPTYTAIPMASAYGGILGAATASLGLLGYYRTGLGQRFEVPLADAVMSAMALLIAELEGAPARYNFPPLDGAVSKVMMPILRDVREHLTDAHVAEVQKYLGANASPGFNRYECADGRFLFVCAPDHVSQNRAFLQTLGIFDRVISEGMVAETPFSEKNSGNNINVASALTPYWRNRLLTLIAERMKTRPAKEWEAALRDANVPVTVVQTTAEWLKDETLHDGGVTIDLADAQHGVVRQSGRHITIEGTSTTSPDVAPRRSDMSLSEWSSPPLARPEVSLEAQRAPILEGIRVLDFSNIIAGPAAGRTLAEFGADVIRIDAPAPQAGPFATMWFGVDVNQGKRAVILDLKTDDGKTALAEMLKNTDVVLHNFLDASARKIGIAHEQLVAIKPDIISCQISAWGGADGGMYKDDPAFDPVLQAASGIMIRYGTPEKPELHGIASCVDYMTGFLAVTGINQALVARAKGRGGSYVRTSLAMGAQLVQFPFMVATSQEQPSSEPSGQFATGAGPGQGLYELADGWIYLGCRPGDEASLAMTLDATKPTVSSIGTAVQKLTFREVQKRVSVLPGASVIPSQTLAQIRSERTRDRDSRDSNWLNTGSFRLCRGEHPSGYVATICEPTWVRPETSPISELAPAPWPGEHTRSILTESGLSEEETDRLFQVGAASSGWSVLRHYLPL